MVLPPRVILKVVGAVERANACRAGFEAVFAQGEVNVVEVFAANLDDRAELLIEERREDFVPIGQFEIDAGVAGEGHLDRGGQQTAVGAIVVGEEFFLPAQQLDRVPEVFQVGGLSTSGVASPICETTCARIEPPVRFLPRPRSINNRTESSTCWSCGVSESRMSATKQTRKQSMRRAR